MAEGNIFIGGSGRCGTTLLRDCILAHPQVWGVHKESHLFAPPAPNLVDIYRHAVDGSLTKDTVARVKAEVSVYLARGYAEHIIARIGRDEYSKSLDEFFALAATWVGRPCYVAPLQIAAWARGLSWPGRKKGATHWCEKSPHNVLNFLELAQLYPAAKLIHIVRDPRDTIDSLATQRWTRTDGYPGVAGCCAWYEQWLDGYEDALRRGLRGLPGYYELRYESFVRFPKQWLNLWSHIGLAPPRRPNMAAVHEGRHKAWDPAQARAFAELQLRRPRVDEWVAETRRIPGAR